MNSLMIGSLGSHQRRPISGYSKAIELGGMEDNRITIVIQRFSDAPEAVEHAEAGERALNIEQNGL